MHICHFSQRARDFIFVTMRMESSLFWNHRRIRKLNLKSGEGLLTSKHQPECGIPVTVGLGTLSQCSSGQLVTGSQAHPGLAFIFRSVSSHGLQHLTPSQSGDSFCVLEFPALFLPTSPLGLYSWKFFQEFCAFAKPHPSGQSCKGNFCYYGPQRPPQHVSKHKYMTVFWEEGKQRSKNLEKKN